MVEMVYRTDDGKFFETKQEAENWENISIKIINMQEYFSHLFDKMSEWDYNEDERIVNSFDAVAEFITINFNDLKNIMESK